MKTAATPFTINIHEEIETDKKAIAKRLVAIPGLLVFLGVLLLGFVLHFIDEKSLSLSLLTLVICIVELVILLCLAPKLFSKKKIIGIYLNQLEKEVEERKSRLKSQKKALANFRSRDKEDPNQEIWIKLAEKVVKEEEEILQKAQQKKQIILSGIPEKKEL